MVQIQGAIAPFPVRIDIGAALPAPTQEQHFDLLCGEGEGVECICRPPWARSAVAPAVSAEAAQEPVNAS